MKYILLAITLLSLTLYAKPTLNDTLFLKRGIENSKDKIKNSPNLDSISVEGNLITINYLLNPAEITQIDNFKPTEKERTLMGNYYRMFLINNFKNSFKNSSFVKKGYDIRFNVLWSDTHKRFFSYILLSDSYKKGDK